MEPCDHSSIFRTQINRLLESKRIYRNAKPSLMTHNVPYYLNPYPSHYAANGQLGEGNYFLQQKNNSVLRPTVSRRMMPPPAFVQLKKVGFAHNADRT